MPEGEREGREGGRNGGRERGKAGREEGWREKWREGGRVVRDLLGVTSTKGSARVVYYVFRRDEQGAHQVAEVI